MLGVEPALAQTGRPYGYAGDNPVNAADPGGEFPNPCDWDPISGYCQAARDAIQDAAGAVVGTWDHLTGSAADYVRRTLVSDLFDVNGLLVKVAQSGFADGVTDGVVQFANQVAGLPGVVSKHLDTLGYYAQHPPDAAPLLKGLVLPLLRAQLSQINPVSVVQGQVQLLTGLWDVVQALRRCVACGSLEHDLGQRFATLVLGAAVVDLGGKFVDEMAGALRGEELFAARAEGDTGAVRDLGGCVNGCFPAGTTVATPGGSAPIEGLHVGDTVLAEDTATGKVAPRRVEAVIAGGVQPTLALDLADGSHLSATPNHLFYVDAGPGIARPEWLAAGDLQAGDRLRTAGGMAVRVVRLRYHAGYTHVYTLTVATDPGTRLRVFFVGLDAVHVHNCDDRLVAKGGRIDGKTLWQRGRDAST